MGSLESDTIEWLPFHISLSCIGEENGNPLQCSCLENPRDGGAWWAAFYGVAQSRTQLKWLSSSSSSSDSHTHYLRSHCLQCDSSLQAPHPSQIHASHYPPHLPLSGSGLCAHLHLELQHPQGPSVQNGLVRSSTLVKPVMDNTTCSWALSAIVGSQDLTEVFL